MPFLNTSSLYPNHFRPLGTPPSLHSLHSLFCEIVSSALFRPRPRLVGQVRNLPVVWEGKVLGIVNVNDISDFSFSMEELGGKKAYMKNISQRKGLPKVNHVQQ